MTEKYSYKVLFSNIGRNVTFTPSIDQHNENICLKTLVLRFFWYDIKEGYDMILVRYIFSINMHSKCGDHYVEYPRCPYTTMINLDNTLY